ncbi:hypothetical protein B0H10DRAFT_806516 [Mycena sp. CBHHK59/15]|nr:hypothetical protein B0H10DRAFT_806516 [Mycena sp. CBHHK59/15]
MDLVEFTDAKDPFSPESDENNPSDIVLRSSDNVDFHTHKTILSFGSPVFRDMSLTLLHKLQGPNSKTSSQVQSQG